MIDGAGMKYSLLLIAPLMFAQAVTEKDSKAPTPSAPIKG